MSGQLGFCQTASDIGRDVLFAPKGGVDDVAARRLRELRNSLLPAYEQQFPRMRVSNFYQPRVFPIQNACWDGKNNLRVRCYALVG